MASTFTTSLGTVNFTATTDSFAEPANADVSVIGFPGGDAIAISISGQRETRRTFIALFANAADFRLFRSMRSKLGTLRIDNWDTTPQNAILVTTAPLPPYLSGEVASQASFILY